MEIMDINWTIVITLGHVVIYPSDNLLPVNSFCFFIHGEVKEIFLV